MALQRAVYRPRDAEHTVLHQVIALHLEAFLGAAAEAGDGTGLPQFVEREFREFLTCGVFERGVTRFRCEGCARARGMPCGRTGSVTVLQRAGGALNTNVHFHTLVLDGVFTEAPGGALAFQPAPGPSDAEVAAVLATERHWVQRLLVRRGLEPADDATGPVDRLEDESPVLAGIMDASVQGRVALGPRAGARVRRLGHERDTAVVTSRGPRQAHLGGFDLHANVWVSANDRAGLERLCRYVLRPPFAQKRLRLRSDGRVALELKMAWRSCMFRPACSPRAIIWQPSSAATPMRCLSAALGAKRPIVSRTRSSG